MSGDTTKLAIGAVIAVVCAAAMLALGATDLLPVLAGSVAVLGLALGTLLVGTSERGRPV